MSLDPHQISPLTNGTELLQPAELLNVYWTSEGELGLFEVVDDVKTEIETHEEKTSTKTPSISLLPGATSRHVTAPTHSVTL